MARLKTLDEIGRSAAKARPAGGYPTSVSLRGGHSVKQFAAVPSRRGPQSRVVRRSSGRLRMDPVLASTPRTIT